MSKKSCKTNIMKSSPAILRRKRKAECDLEEAACSGNCMVALPEPSISDVNKENRAAPCLIRPCPLPKFRWGDSIEVWQNMVKKDEVHPRDHRLFAYHPELQPRMRAILLDWMMEVCEVNSLHRETFYLAQDCIDRYLAVQNDTKRDTLQLIGITCLFIAAKAEEIYPPKLHEFAYVTDGACEEMEIIEQEIIILMYLDWNVSTITICNWLSIMLQVEAIRQNTDDMEADQEFEIRSFDGLAFTQICQLLDLCVLDVSCLRFPYRILATSAIMHLVSKEIGLSVSGLSWAEVKECFRWMAPFFETIRENMKMEIPSIENIDDSDAHNIQSHDVGLKLLKTSSEERKNGLTKDPSNSQNFNLHSNNHAVAIVVEAVTLTARGILVESVLLKLFPHSREHNVM